MPHTLHTPEKPTCPKHPDVVLRCPACSGRKGGKQRTGLKARAARRNARQPRTKFVGEIVEIVEK